MAARCSADNHCADWISVSRRMAPLPLSVTARTSALTSLSGRYTSLPAFTVASRTTGAELLWFNKCRKRYLPLRAARPVAQRLYARAGVTPKDIDVALIYDHFSPARHHAVGGLRLLRQSEGGPFVEAERSDKTAHSRESTWGHLSEAYVIGMTHIREAVEQLRGQAVNQIKDAELRRDGGPAPIPMRRRYSEEITHVRSPASLRRDALEVPMDAWTQPVLGWNRGKELLRRVCSSCHRFRWPPDRFCPHCQSQLTDWVPPVSRGSSHSLLSGSARKDAAEPPTSVPASSNSPKRMVFAWWQRSSYNAREHPHRGGSNAWLVTGGNASVPCSAFLYRLRTDVTPRFAPNPSSPAGPRPDDPLRPLRR